MLGEEFERERSDRGEAHGDGPREIIGVPGLCRIAQLPAILDLRRGLVEPVIVAHSDIVDDTPAITELLDLPQQARRGLVEAVVIGGCHLLAMGRQEDIADFQHGMLPLAGDIRNLRPGF